ncbi:MAG: hypothetical protein A3J55_03450 [Candidatus Ryanbacteria bacterium RIFCSPHIGHO2_02_FULL_45_17b]|uniref:TraC-like domain-containing protein n=1 Tax=Candidatus Ryanbacteria bacterium RIFCSPHIGHO2_01_FULL_45_22 TaxID=1802114 RepID=A0A1G2G209_9BACT|nr:MAG: hypothetical protein A2719_04655 [Candidatus Ryanbacteria bacterium RIFCSPHIGHO2_01_FULL_45_22]OGZ47516.1 MAG: hypothetical protein A3J55_03450 [Candidatus Ryanbacteria bacterium RIFCSPHIGHO2_02_FULL_45_17b]
MAKPLPAQQLVEIKEIRDGVLVLKDGSLRVIMIASSLNFALKSQEEQDAIIFQYQNYLNSLDFSVETFVQSRQLNIEPYLETLRDRLRREYNELMKIQTSEYIEFIKSFVESANIMTHSFYVVVPFTPVRVLEKETMRRGILSFLPDMSGRRKKEMKEIEEHGVHQALFEEYKTQLYQRVEVARQGLARISVRLVPLNTEELIELFYGLYNPGELEKGKMPEVAM